MKLESYNPSDSRLIGSVEITTDKELADNIKSAKEAQLAWAALSLEKRLQHMQSIATIVEKNKEQLADLIATEMGMPINEATRSDVDSGLHYLKWYIENAVECLRAETTYETDGEVHKVFYEPKGVVASIVPWNFPFSNFVWQGCQNLIVGNAVVMKHSELTPLCSNFIAELVAKSTLPKNVFIMIYGDGAVGEKLAKSDGINHICFTGSTKVGKHLYKVAADKFISATMELGGSAAGIVFADANIDKAVDTIFISKFTNCGQICDGLKRLIVHTSIYDKIVKRLSEIVKSKKVGDASNKDTDIGPLVSKAQLDAISEQVEDAKKRGATVITGGKKLDTSDGNYYEPTLLGNISTDARVWCEEAFGPVLPIKQFKTIDEAIALANDTQYGLGGYVFTEDAKVFERVAREIKTGMVAWNELYYVIPQDPFGGYKESGLGRNHARWGFQELCNIKVVTFRK